MQEGGFAANRRTNRTKQNNRFDAQVVLKALARSDRKFDSRIFGKREKFAEGSKLAKIKNLRKYFICDFECRGASSHVAWLAGTGLKI